ncbi:MAG: DUF2505 family protein [bacterium]|nr:DUF2505 family protein [bacterium]
MATKFELVHEFPSVSIELFEKHLNHPQLNQMLAKMPAFRSRDLVEKKELKNGEIIWKFKVVAGGDIPSSVKKVISPDMFTWWENTHFKPDEHCIHFHIEPLTGASKFEGKGQWKLIKQKKGTKRIIEGEMNVKIPFVGKIVESFLIKELKRNYEVEPEIQKEFYAQMQ